MWSRYHWFCVRVKIRKKGKKGFRLWLPPLSFYVMRTAILSADGLLWLIRGQAGRLARAGSDVIQKTIATLQSEGLDVDVRVKKSDEDVKVRVHMV